MVTKPPAFTRGVTCKVTPVLRYSISLTVGALASIVLVEVRVGIGISSPTLIVAVWLSSTISDGEERMLTLLSAASALIAARTWPALSITA